MLLGIEEVAELLEVKPATVSMWRQRHIFPVPYSIVSGRPAWRLETVLGWHESRKEKSAGPGTSAQSVT